MHPILLVGLTLVLTCVIIFLCTGIRYLFQKIQAYRKRRFADRVAKAAIEHGIILGAASGMFKKNGW